MSRAIAARASLGAALFALVVAAGCAAPAPSPTAVPTNAPAAAATTGATREVGLLSAVRPTLVELVDVLEKGDVPRARTALHAFDAGWNGIEVYVNFRSPALYKELETDLEAKLEDELEAPRPRAPEALPLAESLLAKYDEAIQLAQTGPALSPLFDDVAAVRIVRAHLREVPPALKANDLTTARTAYASFRQGWPQVQGIIRTHAPDAPASIEQAMAKVDTAMQPASPSLAELSPLVDDLLKRYNDGLTAVSNAAKSAPQPTQKAG